MIFFHKCVFVDILLLIVKISYAEPKYEISSIDLPYQHNYGCGERVLVNQSSGVISYSIVDPVINLCWFITAKSQSNIAVSFSYFNLHSDDIYYPYNSILRDECSTYIVVSDASTKLNLHKKLPSKRICGSSLFHKVPTIFMKTDRVLVHLVKQDYQDVSQQMGFSLYYSIFKKCATQLDIERFTFLTSLNLPRMNPPIPCSWNITSTHNLPLRVVVNSVKLLFNSRLLIYDGPDSNSPLLAVWIASFIGEFVTSTSDKLFIKFLPGNESDVLNYSEFNITVKEKGYCLPGTFSCGDDTCFDQTQRCDKTRNCASGVDERGCSECAPDKIWCGSKEWDCYSPSSYCDANRDCVSGGADEKDCDSCANGAYLCPISRRCIYESWKCDNQFDCGEEDHSDEEGCHYTASRPVITAAIVGSLVCGLLLSVALGCLCKLYTLRAAARNRLRRDRPIAPTPLGRIARELLRREAPPSYNMAVEGMDDETHDSSRRSTRSSRRRNGRRRSRHRNREPTIRRAQPSENRDSTNNNRGDSTEITTADNTDNTQAVLGAPTSDPFVGGTNILVSLGLTEIQAALSQATPSTSRAREASTSSRSRKDPEQAGPLPSKKKIAPVRVGAPCDGEMTADIAGCVYPNPPSYHEVVGNTPDQLIQTIAPEDRESLNPSPDDVEDDVSAKSNQRKSRNFWRRPFRGLFRSTHDFQPLLNMDSESLDSVTVVDMVNMGGIDQSVLPSHAPTTSLHAIRPNDSMDLSNTSTSSDDFRQSPYIPRTRVVTADDIFSRTISDSLTERT